MSDRGPDGEFGATDDVQGNLETRTVQSEGRLNIPNDYLHHIGVEKGEQVMITAKEDSLEIRKASAEQLAFKAALKYISSIFRK